MDEKDYNESDDFKPKKTPYSDDYKRRFEVDLKKKLIERGEYVKPEKTPEKKVEEVKIKHNLYSPPPHNESLFEEFERKVEDEVKHHPKLTKFLIFLAFAIPIAILLYAFYINYLPFGWEKQYELTIDEEGKVSPISNEIYLTNTQGRKLLSLPNGVNGQVNVVIEPDVVLKNATVNITIQGDDGVYLGTPLKLNLSELDWDYNWDFTKGVPEDLEGNAEYREDLGCVYFDAVKEETLFFPNSSDMFEDGPMSIYVRYKPGEISELLGGYQQLVGHYNWEILQGENSVRFQVGRMDESNGLIYTINQNLEEGFWQEEHEILAIYSPGENGYLEFRVDNNFGERKEIGNEIIYQNYNSNKDLSFGWTSHNSNSNPFYDGCIYETKIINETIKEEKNKEEIKFEQFPITIPIVGFGKFNYIELDISQ